MPPFIGWLAVRVRFDGHKNALKPKKNAPVKATVIFFLIGKPLSQGCIRLAATTAVSEEVCVERRNLL